MAALSSTVSAGEILELIASGRAQTRSALSKQTGLSRSTVAERLEALFEAQLIREGEDSRPSGGRPSKMIALNRERHLIVAADVGEDHIRVIITDLSGAVLIETVGAVSVSDGAENVVTWIIEQGLNLVASLDRDAGELIGVALAVPAPVDYNRGEVTAPSVMTGWEGAPLEAIVHQRLVVPVIVENDVNARGLGEYLESWRTYDEVFYVKAGTGIGSAIISAGNLFRGANGAAGDIGHIRLEPDTGPLCRCGAVGCVEALAAGWSLVRDLRKQGFDVSDTRDLMELVGANLPEAIHLLREAGRTLGRAIAYSVNLLNPNLIIVGGSLTGIGQYLLTGIREAVYQHSLPLATRELSIVQGKGSELCGAIGAAHLVISRTLRPDQINAHLKSISS